MTDLDDLRRRGIRLIMLVGWVANLTLVILALARGDTDGLLAAFVGSLLNIVPTLAALRRRSDLGARIAVALMIAIEPALLLYVMRGAAWQLDMHMYFFVSLASLTVLCDWRPLVAASSVIAVHHLILSLMMPSWVFAGGGGVERVAIHALAVALQCAILSYVATRLAHTVAAQAQARLRSDELATEATAARSIAEAARLHAEQALAAATAAEARAAEERARREQIENHTAETRRHDLLSVASDFERSIAAVAEALGGSARTLEGSATALNIVAQDTRQQAIAVTAAALEAADAARSVAGGVSTLSRSISIISVSVSQQVQLTQHARTRSTLGDAAVKALAASTDDVGGLADAISTIASRTDMLALNAAIESARAGHAGHGFAVLAQEVKALAGQAGSATQQIASLVDGINARASDANGNFQQVSSAISELADAAGAIRNEIDEQRAATDEIGHHADEAAAGMAAMTHRVESVSEVASTAERLSAEVRNAAIALLDQVHALQGATDNFVSMLKAA